MAYTPRGAPVLVAANVLHLVPAGLASRSRWIRAAACGFRSHLAAHPSAILAVVRAVPRAAVVPLIEYYYMSMTLADSKPEID